MRRRSAAASTLGMFIQALVASEQGRERPPPAWIETREIDGLTVEEWLPWEPFHGRAETRIFHIDALDLQLIIHDAGNPLLTEIVLDSLRPAQP